MYTLLPTSLIEQAHEQRLALEKEAEKCRLLQQAKQSIGRVPVLRQVALSTGDLLIAGGAWLKQRAQWEPGSADLQTVSGRFSR